MKIILTQSYKSIPKGIDFDLHRFSVLTGRNGSGKSHLLEAIAGKTAAKVIIDGKIITNIHHVGFNGLNPHVDEQSDQTQIMTSVTNWWGSLQSLIGQYNAATADGQIFPDVAKDFVPNYVNNPPLQLLVARMLKSTGKKFSDLSEDDVFKNLNFVEIAQNQLFFSQCAMIFKAYHTRKIKNEFAQFRNSQGANPQIPFFTETEFVTKYGPAPWELINELMARANLPYKVTSPELADFDLPYRLRLLDAEKNVEISVNDLSSGEKVLMSLALAIYNTQEGGAKPELLLLDEPDAPLHPQFSKLLIETLVETITDKTGVNVVITTHSPSTVAMAPDGCVFEVDRDTKIPKLVSNAHAVGILTEGISFLKISYEDRKQIFVESKYDVFYLQRLHNLLNRKYDFTYQPVFLEPHSGTSNCTDVIEIVGKLRGSGNDLAYGIIDFDNINIGTNEIFVLGQGSRYAIENYLLDPIYVCLALIRYGKKAFNDYGVTRIENYVEALSLTQDECQGLITNFLSSMDITMTELTPTTLENGFRVDYPTQFLRYKGHDYELLIQANLPELKAISKGKGDSALKLAIVEVIAEYPQFLPKEISQTFIALLGTKNNELKPKSF